MADPATATRAAADFDDGIALGVAVIPTLLEDGERLNACATEKFRVHVDAAPWPVDWRVLSKDPV